MFERRIPEWLRHAPAPSVRGFAILAGFEAVTRGILISVFPVALYDALQDAALVSAIYFGIGIVSLIVGLLVPFLNRFAPRRAIYCLGVLTYVVGSACAIFGPPEWIVLALILHSIATVIAFVCFNAYVLDYIARIELGKCETLRMFYSALGWTVGAGSGRVSLDMVETGALLGLCVGGLAAFGRVPVYAARQRQTDHARAQACAQSARFSGPFSRPAQACRRVAFRGHPLLRLVGLCCLPADIRA